MKKNNKASTIIFTILYSILIFLVVGTNVARATYLNNDANKSVLVESKMASALEVEITTSTKDILKKYQLDEKTVTRVFEQLDLQEEISAYIDFNFKKIQYDISHRNFSMLLESEFKTQFLEANKIDNGVYPEEHLKLQKNFVNEMVIAYDNQFTNSDFTNYIVQINMLYLNISNVLLWVLIVLLVSNIIIQWLYWGFSRVSNCFIYGFFGSFIGTSVTIFLPWTALYPNKNPIFVNYMKCLTDRFNLLMILYGLMIIIVVAIIYVIKYYKFYQKKNLLK
ncbi:MAG: hypothetical protein WBO70_07930 [Erysipelotrichaceae bacterium]